MIEILYIIITIGLTIFVHELGHFMAAKRLGVKVEKFSIGWGPRIASFKIGETEYIISFLVFLGGYVKMAGESPQEAEAAGEGGFLKQAPWKKMLISVSGVVQNAIFAVFLMWVVFMYGTDTLKPVINEVIKGQPAYTAGIIRGDEVTAINNEKVLYWNQISEMIEAAKGAPVKISVKRADKELEFTVKPVMEESEDLIKDKKMKPDIGIMPVIAIPVVDEVIKGSPAEAAGMKKGDMIESINGRTISYWDDLTVTVRSSNGKELAVKVKRDSEAGKEIIFNIVPKKETMEDKEKKKVETYIIGVVPMSNIIKERYGPVKSLVKGCSQAWFFTDITVKSVYKMITRKLEPDIAGPLGVAQIAYKVAKTGLINLLLLIAIININLAIFNMLPLVPFDGGLILLFLIEAITGKPVPLKVQEVMMEIGWALVILLIVLVTYSDILRMVKGG
jgi:regulator of sigma E protease